MHHFFIILLAIWSFLPINALKAETLEQKVSNKENSRPSSSSRLDSYAVIKGEVRDSAGAPIPNATVVIASKGPFSEITSRTSASGTFYSDSLKIGETYSVTVLLLGYLPYETQEFRVKNAQEISFSIVLAPREVVIKRGKSSTNTSHPAGSSLN